MTPSSNESNALLASLAEWETQQAHKKEDMLRVNLIIAKYKFTPFATQIEEDGDCLYHSLFCVARESVPPLPHFGSWAALKMALLSFMKQHAEVLDIATTLDPAHRSVADYFDYLGGDGHFGDENVIRAFSLLQRKVGRVTVGGSWPGN